VSADLGQLVSDLEPYARAFVDAVARAGLSPQVTSTFRTRAEQTRLYKSSLEGKERFPVMPPGLSPHEYGWAFDMVSSDLERGHQRRLGAAWQRMGGVWGGRWRDPVHFELPGASQQARINGQAAIAENPAIVEDILNTLAGFVPVWGEVQMSAEFLKMFPQYSKSHALMVLSNPAKFLILRRPQSRLEMILDPLGVFGFLKEVVS